MNKVVNNKCFIYVRKAVKEQNQSDEVAVADQITQLKKLAKEKKLSIAHIFIEIGSGIGIKRKELKKMLKRLKTDNIKVVLCSNPDRITRDYKDLAVIDTTLREAGAVIMTPDYQYGANSRNDLRWDLQVFLAKAYQERLREDVRLATANVKAKKAIILAKASTEKEAYEPSK
ncbi:MAG: resolvase domain-containing protein, nonfunctional [Microgenomates group bacterium GW2011_GWA1_48_10]|nr:MAG: resolvase domain-containing protein, nonfunctional [Microgenomates group bacterium GW2011_GWA1_48_10]OHA94333.1 MAG: hypothetical protein A3B88_04450 [Candidatus Zambryskibacteria bacterium RIFCSPHIGHO2_02_FULL_39_19]